MKFDRILRSKGERMKFLFNIAMRVFGVAEDEPIDPERRKVVERITEVALSISEELNAQPYCTWWSKERYVKRGDPEISPDYRMSRPHNMYVIGSPPKRMMSVDGNGKLFWKTQRQTPDSTSFWIPFGNDIAKSNMETHFLQEEYLPLLEECLSWLSPNHVLVRNRNRSRSI
jgi:hypothetical protein